MTWAPGKFVICGSPTCDSTDLRDVGDERWNATDQVFIGAQRCRRCRADMAYSRRPTDQERRDMAKKPATTKPKKQPLPGMEDRAIRELEEVATSYAEIRDERMALNLREQELKANALKLMRKHDRMVYKRDGIEIVRVPGEEDVKVRVKKHDEADGEDASV